MIKVKIHNSKQLTWVRSKWPESRFSGTARIPVGFTGQVYIQDCDDVEAAQIALTLGTTVRRVESFSD